MDTGVAKQNCVIYFVLRNIITGKCDAGHFMARGRIGMRISSENEISRQNL